MQITKPMLAETLTDINSLRFPVLCTPKLDGFRCLKVGGKALTRSFKPIPNKFVREWIEGNCPDGVDGELMLREGSFSDTASAIGRRDGTPDFVYHIFDYVRNGDTKPYADRMVDLNAIATDQPAGVLWGRIFQVIPTLIRSVEELEAYESKCLERSFEGVMIRDPHGPYKCGRSTEREGYLLKLKRFADSEAVILDTEEGQSNRNEAERDAFGHTKRSTAKAGMVGKGILGSLRVRDVHSGVEFSVGYNSSQTGLDSELAWSQRDNLVGRVVKYKYQPTGVKTAPRFPTLLGFREAWDMSN